MMKNERLQIAFRVDGNDHIGMGHLSECYNLAVELQIELFADIHFLMLETSLNNAFVEWIRQRGIQVWTVSGGVPYQEDRKCTITLLRQLQPAAVITDLLTADPSDQDFFGDPHLDLVPVGEYVTWLRSLGFPVVSITADNTPVDIAPDLLVALHPRQTRFNYPLNGTKRLLGPDYFILGPDFVPYRDIRRKISPVAKHLLLAFGGSDPDGFTIKFARVLHNLPGVDMSAVLGPGLAHQHAVREEISALGVRCLHAVPNLAALLWETDLAVTAAGNMLFELAALGTPAVVLSTRERQFENAVWFAEQGSILHLGLGSDVSEVKVRTVVVDLLSDREGRQTMSEAGRQAVDGHGGRRIVSALRELIRA